MAKMNGVESRVGIEVACTPDILRREDLRGAHLIVDCEGYEAELLDPARVPGLVDATIVVELHDCCVPGISELVIGRFSATHDIQFAHAQARDPAAFPLTEALSVAERALAVDEDRPAGPGGAPQRWALLAPFSQARHIQR